MITHNISINKKYFEPIREGKISLLIFDKKVLNNVTPGDYALASYGSYEVGFKILRVYIKAFEDITEEEANKAGFLNKDFLKEILIKDFNLKTVFSFNGENIDTTLFFLVEISPEKEEEKNESCKVNLYKNTYDKELYEIDWEDLL